MNKLKMFLFL